MNATVPLIAPAPARRTRDGTQRLPSVAATARFSAPDQAIYAKICEAVLDQRLAPGVKLKEVALADLFGATRGTIRKVLTRLAHVKLVELRPNRGAIVASPSVEESRDLFAARRAIEGAVVDLLASRLTKDQLRELRSHVRREQDAYRSGEVRAGLKLSIGFHRLLAAMAGNTVLADILDQLVSRTPLVVLAHRSPRQPASCSDDEHALLVDALAAGDADTAVAVMKEHLHTLQGQLDLHDSAPTVELAEIFEAWGA